MARAGEDALQEGMKVCVCGKLHPADKAACHTPYVEWGGEFFTVAVADHHFDGDHAHWHLTLTGPVRGQERHDLARAAEFGRRMRRGW